MKNTYNYIERIKKSKITPIPSITAVCGVTLNCKHVLPLFCQIFHFHAFVV